MTFEESSAEVDVTGATGWENRGGIVEGDGKTSGGRLLADGGSLVMIAAGGEAALLFALEAWCMDTC